MKLIPECGVTETSLKNAVEIIAELGLPDYVQLVNDANDTSGHVVSAAWENVDGAGSSFSHKFTGFSWGYKGEGPSGLVKFFDLSGLYTCVPSEIVSHLPQDRCGVLLSFSRNAWLVEYAYEGAPDISPAIADVVNKLKNAAAGND